MSRSQRLAMIDLEEPKLSLVRQCAYGYQNQLLD